MLQIVWFWFVVFSQVSNPSFFFH